ncbi:MAG: hypothetical protein Q9219_002977 [cf. Caloplaca sp. 3 TL-2023]
MSKKRRREQPNVDIQLIEIYEDLANENEQIRFKAAHAFLTKFSQENYHSCDELTEAVRRLIRGLCSGRKAARLGFSVALTELLSQRWGETPVDGAEELKVPELVDILTKQTEITGKVSGQEERDHQFGRLFGVESFIKSGILFQPHASIETWYSVLDIICDIAKKKPWLREECGWILYGASQALRKGHPEMQFVQAVMDKLCGNGLAKSPEGIAIWLKFLANFPDVQFPRDIWRDGNPLHRKETVKLAKILKEASSGGSTDETNDSALQRGSWSSKIHFVWNVIFTELIENGLPEDSGARSKTISFGEFWHYVVDEHLFASSSSEERKYWGFLLFQELFSRAPQALLPSLFTANLKRSLTNQLASKDRYLHLAAEKSVKSIFKRVEGEPSCAFAALDALSASSFDSRISFDQLTKTKTVERLIALIDDTTARRLGDKLCGKLVRMDVHEEKEASARRQVIADQLLSLLRSRQSTDSSDTNALLDDILDVFVTYSYFTFNPSASDQSRAPSPPILKGTQDMLRSRLSTCLSHVLDKFSQPASIIYKVVSRIRSNRVDNTWQINLGLTETISERIAAAHTIVERLEASLEQHSSEDRASTEAFMLLFLLTILQVYNGDADAVSMLDELGSCCDLLINREQESNQQGSEVLVEILLSLTSKNSRLFRQLTKQVFSAFTSVINSDGLQLLIKVLETKENLAGQDEMFENDEDEDAEASDHALSVGSDVEEVVMKDANGEQSPSAEESDMSATSGSSDGDSDSDDDGKEDEELDAFDAKLAQALKTRPADVDFDAATDYSCSDDEEMNDEQMEALDEHIAQIFKERKKITSNNQKKQRKDAKETIVNFKCRVLELLEVYIKQQHTKAIALELLLPLLTVTRTTTSQLVSGKACNLVREFSRICKGKELPKVDDAAKITKLLKEIHAEAMREASNAHASACSQGSLLLVRLLVAMDREHLREAVKIYARTQEALLMDPKCRVKMSFFTDWMNWCATAKLAK